MINKPSKQFELLSRWAMSLLEPENFESTLINDDSFEIILEKTTYCDLLLFNYSDNKSIEKSRKFVMEYLINKDNDLFQRYKTAFILDRMINDPDELLPGLRYLSGMARSCNFIPEIFIGLESETDMVPTKDQIDLWDKSAFIKAQQPLDLYRDQIIEAARELRQTLKDYGV